MDDQRRWEELEVDCLVNIFGRVGMEPLLLDVPFVCKSWHKVTLNPSCWQSLVFPDLLNLYYDYDGEGGYYYEFIERFLNEYQLDENCFSVTAFVKFVIDRSKGQATCLELSPCASEDALKYATDECPALKTLALSGDLLNRGSSTVQELIGKWKHLESLVLESSYNFKDFFTGICFHCKNLRHLRVENADIGKDEAMAIVDFLPKLKELILRQAFIDRDDLVTLLRGCKELVRLDVSYCIGFDEGDEEISKLASHIENFSSKGSTLIDNDSDHYEVGGSFNDQFGWGFNSD